MKEDVFDHIIKTLNQQELNLYELFDRFDVEGNKKLDKIQFNKLLQSINLNLSSHQVSDLIYLINQDE